MRRGTPAALTMGYLLRTIREAKGKTMRDVAYSFGAFPAYISQVEKGERALKEEMIRFWATGLEIREDKLYGLFAEMHLEGNQAAVISIMKEILPGVELERELIVTGPPKPIVRNRGTAINKTELDDLIDQLTAQERQRVLGYVNCLMESRD